MPKKALFYLIAVLAGVATAVAGNSLYQPIHLADLEKAEIFYFYSDYCHYCQQLKPYIESIAEKREIVMCNVNSMDNNCSSIASSLGWKRILTPTLVVKAEKEFVFVGYSQVKQALDTINALEGQK